MKPWADFNGLQIYNFIRLIDPKGYEWLVEYHGGIHGATSVSWGVDGWGRSLQWPCDGTWQWSRLPIDDFQRFTGLIVPHKLKDHEGIPDPWWIERQRSWLHWGLKEAHARTGMRVGFMPNVFTFRELLGLANKSTYLWENDQERPRTFSHLIRTAQIHNVPIEDALLIDWRHSYDRAFSELIGLVAVNRVHFLRWRSEIGPEHQEGSAMGFYELLVQTPAIGLLEILPDALSTAHAIWREMFTEKAA